MSSAEESKAPFPAWIELPDGSSHELTGDCQIGRVEGNQIVNPDNRVSRSHAAVQRQGKRFVLVDFGSTNGTFLNNVRISKPMTLRDGDAFVIGSQRYVFRQPVPGTGSETNAVFLTVVAVGKVTCWMLSVTAPESADAATTAWLDGTRERLSRSGAGVKQPRAGALFAHWREGVCSVEVVRAEVVNLARASRPAGARLGLHFGAVRIGPAAIGKEEILLGADVTQTHNLEKVASAAGAEFVLTEPAVRSLGLAAMVTPLADAAGSDAPSSPPLFAFTRA